MGTVNTERLWWHAHVLCEEIGPRLSGSPGGRRAAAYIENHFRQCGLQVDVQDYACPGWEHEATELSLLGEGGTESLPAFAQTFSEACDVEADLRIITTPDELELAPDLEGKALLLTGRIATRLAADRNATLLSVEDRRPAALIAVSPDETVSTKLVRDPFLRVPAAAVSESVGRLLVERDAARVRLQIRARRYEATGRNVIGKIDGSEAGHIVVAAHYDTSAESPGATDNASGTAVLLELCTLLATAGRNGPGITFVAYDAEEYGRHSSLGGNLGSVEYVRRNPVEASKARAVVEVDCVGTVRVPPRVRAMGWPPLEGEGIREALRPFSRYEIDIRPESEPPRTALNLPGVPTVAFVNDFTRLPIHTAQDTIDLMSAKELAYTAGAAAAVLERG